MQKLFLLLNDDHATKNGVNRYFLKWINNGRTREVFNVQILYVRENKNYEFVLSIKKFIIPIQIMNAY